MFRDTRCDNCWIEREIAQPSVRVENVIKIRPLSILCTINPMNNCPTAGFLFSRRTVGSEKGQSVGETDIRLYLWHESWGQETGYSPFNTTRHVINAWLDQDWLHSTWTQWLGPKEILRLWNEECPEIGFLWNDGGSRIGSWRGSEIEKWKESKNWVLKEFWNCEMKRVQESGPCEMKVSNN